MELVPVDIQAAPAVYLIIGIPGSGKSTVSGALARRFQRGAHIEGDALQDLIVSGGRPPSPAHDPEADRQIFLRARNAALLADSFHAAGVTPVIDDVVVRRVHLGFYRDRIRGGPLNLVVLAPGPAVAAVRNLARDKTLTDDWSFLDTAMRAELTGEGHWVDNARQTVEETVDEILRRTARWASPPGDGGLLADTGACGR
jgi:gluconate kinase